MALSSTGVFEVRTTGTDNLSGYFNPALGGVDYSQRDNAIFTRYDAVTDGSSTITIPNTGNLFQVGFVGNGVLVVIAGNSPVIAEILSVNSSTSITVDVPIAAGTREIRIGGALGTIGRAAQLAVTGNHIWIKSGIYNTAAVAIPVGGNGTTTTQGIAKWEGYGTTRGDGVRATLRASGITNQTLFRTTGGQFHLFKNLIFDGNNLTGIRGAQPGTQWSYFENCAAINCKNGGIWGATELYRCEIGNCSGASGADSCSSIVECFGYGQTGGEALFHARSGVVENCLMYNCTVTGVQADSGGRIWNNRIYNCALGIVSGTGIPRPSIIIGNIVWKCIQNYNVNFGARMSRNASGGWSTSPDSNTTSNITLLTSNPFSDVNSLDFRLTPLAVTQLESVGIDIFSNWKLNKSSAARTVQL